MNRVILKGSLGFLFLSTVLISCKSSQEVASKKESVGINVGYMDKSVNPANDFNRYVNGTWLDKTEIPADRTRWGSFDELRKNTDDDVMAILKDAIKDKTIDPNSDQAKAISLYKTVLDTVSRNKAGIDPLKPYLAKINSVQNADQLVALLAEMEPEMGLGFFGSYIGADAKNSNKNVIYVGTGSLGLPDRDYYVSDAPDNKEKREKYVAHVTRMLQYLGESETTANANAKKILALETKMSTATLDRVERRDRRKTYNPMSFADLQKLAPTVKWDAYFQSVGIGKVDSLVVSQPKYLQTVETILKDNQVEDWKAYMRWTALRGSAGLLSTDIENANFDFYGKTLTGAVKQRPAEERALATVNGRLGEALGKLYVAKKFPPEAKAKAQAMIANVMLAFDNRINNLPWMTKATKENAKIKLNKFRVKIGYPDKWKDYSALEVKSPEQGGTYFDNSRMYARWSHKKNIEKNVPGLEFIMQLEPVTYNFDFDGLNTATKTLPDSEKITTVNPNTNVRFTGFIAQDVEKAAKSIGYDFSGVDKAQNENDFYGLRYSEFVVPMVKAIQEQQSQIELLKKQNADLMRRLTDLENKK